MAGIFLFLLLAHILGDYYLQSENLSLKKDSLYKYVCLHCLIYTAVSLCLSLLSKLPEMIFLVSSISHFAIDTGKYVFYKKKKPARFFNNQKSSTYIFISDQLLHISCIYITSLIYSQEIKDTFNLNKEIIKWVILILFIGKPVNIAIKKLLITYKPQDLVPGNMAGAFIGILERLLILIFLSINQYSAIGLVLTAKSIARYKRITDDPDFAEYYLSGTLLSVLFAVAGFLFVFGSFEFPVLMSKF